MKVFEDHESNVRSYCRAWPAVFDRAVGSWLYDESGRPYLDFFTGAGTLNYGHNNPVMKEALLEYVASDRVIHSLDMFTAAKRAFLVAFEEVVLRPRELDYRVQFPGPAGTNAVEAALKLARKVTGRTEVLYFANAFHGVTLGSLAVTGNPFHRGGAGVPLTCTTPLPFDNPSSGNAPDLDELDRLLAECGNGPGAPAAVIVETVQGEGGVNVARPEWLRGLADRCRQHDVLLIVDDVQMGCGRTGPFFSFEAAAVKPDMVCLSKSISGFGLPMALTLIRPDLDIWEPGEHTGTFRGFNPAFVTGTVALRSYWMEDSLERSTAARGLRIGRALTDLADSGVGAVIHQRGCGMVQGLAFDDPKIAGSVRDAAFELGLIVETAGPRDEVVKLLPPLTITDSELDQGLALLDKAVHTAC